MPAISWASLDWEQQPLWQHRDPLASRRARQRNTGEFKVPLHRASPSKHLSFPRSYILWCRTARARLLASTSSMRR